MKNVIPYNLFEMSKIQIQNYYPYLQRIEDIVRARDHEKYANFPENWYVSIDYDITYFSNFVNTGKNFSRYYSCQLFNIQIFFKDKFKSFNNEETGERRVHEYYIRWNESKLIIKRSLHSFIKDIEPVVLPLEALKNPHRFLKRVVEEIKEMEKDV